MSWLGQLFSRRHRYDELSESIREHLDEKIEDMIDHGMTREEAERKARREFGNVTLIEQRSREVWQWPTLESLWADTKYVLRRLRRAPLFTAIALITLAVGVGANTVIFSVVNGVLLKPLSYPNPDRLIAVDHLSQQAGFKKMGISPSIYFVYREQNTTLADIGAYDGDELDVTGAGTPEHLRVLDVTDGTLPLMGISPALGRLFTRQDECTRSCTNRRAHVSILAATVRWSVIGYRQLDYGGRRAQGNNWRSSPTLPFPRSERLIVDTSDAMGSCDHSPRKF
jgi:hypothetical protein